MIIVITPGKETADNLVFQVCVRKFNQPDCSFWIFVFI